MMMRHLASVGDTAVEHTAWSPWSMNPSQAAASVSSVPPNVGGRYPGNAGSLRMRTTPSTGNGNIANILAMTETDLQRTNSVTDTVNNLLLQM
ncbi:hypothetical protein Gotri_020236 [Gossypium trilobum]|nr:hypothetical protein [Gossypium trilobum]